jgi:hypothetical protein
VLSNKLSVISIAANGSSRTLENIRVKAGCHSKQPQQLFNGLAVCDSWLDENDRIVGVERGTTCSTTAREGGKETHPGSKVNEQVKNLHDEHKEHRRQGVTLSHSTVVIDFIAGDTVDQDAGGCRGEQKAYKVDPNVPKSQMLQKIYDERPRNCIESTGNIQLKKDGGCLGDME